MADSVTKGDLGDPGEEAVAGAALQCTPHEVFAEDSTEVAIDRIRVRQRLRAPDEVKVAALMASIREMGVLQPVVVTTTGQLVAGAHRVEALRRLGEAMVPAVVVDADDDEARLMEVEENLIRKELSVLEKSEHIVLREQLLEEMGRRARSGENQHTRGGGGTVPPPLTRAQLAREVGVSDRTYKRYRRIGALYDATRRLLKDHGLDESTTRLDRLSRIEDPDEQLAAARRWARLDAPATQLSVKKRRGASQGEDRAAAEAAVRELGDNDCCFYFTVVGPDGNEVKGQLPWEAMVEAIVRGAVSGDHLLEDVLAHLPDWEEA